MSLPTSLPVVDIEKRLSSDESKNSKDLELVGDDERDIATSVPTSLPTVDHDLEKQLSYDIKKNSKNVEAVDDGDSNIGVLENERDIATHVISIHDNSSLNPWTLRAFIIGMGLSAFGAVLAEIYYFKPQMVFVSTMFLGVISYVLGIAMETLIPARGFFRYLNPHPFNKKENAFIIIMASAAAHSALGTQVLAVQRLYYNITPNPGESIFLLFSSQLLGYGIGGLLRSVLLYPTKMLYPTILPLVSMFDAFFKDASGTQKKLRLFWIAFTCIFVWELFPEWIFPLLTGFSVFCLANQNSPDFTRMFGGSNGNEGLGLFSIGLDWQYIGGLASPLAIPLRAQFSNFIGYLICIVVFVGIYYGNVWEAKRFPFLSQELFYANGTVYNQLLILNEKFEVDKTLLEQQGLPFYAGTWVSQLITTNLGIGATFGHLLIWNRDDMRDAWSWISPSGIKQIYENFNWRFWQDDGKRDELAKDKTLDPHYKEMLKYPDTPNSWYIVTLTVSIIASLVIIYKTDSTLPWWGFFISILVATVSILFFGVLYAITGQAIIIQGFIQMLGGFVHPGKPMANMYFVLFGYNSVSQAQLLLRDLKLAQYTKLPPRAAFTAQIIGTLLGCVLNFIVMNSIIDNQRDILLSVQGTNVWSGQLAQLYNSQAITWGALSHELLAAGKRYQFVAWAYLIGLFVPVPFWILHKKWPKLGANYLYTPLICFSIGALCFGINSFILSYFCIAFLSQWWLRTRYPRWFVKYNYILAAALDGGTQVMVFILTFAVFGASGDAHLFPKWWGANQNGNYDRCVRIGTSGY